MLNQTHTYISSHIRIQIKFYNNFIIALEPQVLEESVGLEKSHLGIMINIT